MRRIFQISTVFVLALALGATGCIEDDSASSDGDRASNGDAGTGGAAADGTGGDDGAGGGDDGTGGGNDGTGGGNDGTGGGNDGAGGGNDGAGGTAGSDGQGADDGAGGDEPDDLPPPPDSDERDDLCEFYCLQVDTCLFAACPALADVTEADEFCNGCRGISTNDLAELAQLSCEEFNDEIFDFSDELESFCSDEPVPDECDQICERASECGAGFDAETCGRFCRDVPPEARRCATEADSCQGLFACFMEGPDEPEPEEICENYCGRQALCVLNECVTGALPDGWVADCEDACLRDVPDQQARQAIFEPLCPEVVQQVRQTNPEIDARCDASEEEVCELLCDAQVAACDPDIDCLAECRDWDEENLLCLEFAQGCDAALSCFQNPENEARCEQYCTQLEGCLLEACPPRVIPPQLSTNCAAGCFQQPPPDQLFEFLEDASCREVRGFVYQQNRELAPICEGGREFRPTGEECAALCDNALGECVGLGGRNFCIAGCASFTRDQYECILAAQGECNAIDACVAEE
jgi:hypothetical protein